MEDVGYIPQVIFEITNQEGHCGIFFIGSFQVKQEECIVMKNSSLQGTLPDNENQAGRSLGRPVDALGIPLESI